MKVTTDGCLFGAWVTERVRSQESLVNSRDFFAGGILEVGSGTGLLSLMIAQQSNANITSVEIDKDAFEQASENITASPWADRIKIIHADTRVYEFSSQYDVIICNPPFYENELKSDNSKKNIAHHNEGLLLPELLAIIKRNLKPDGIFFLLLPFKRNDEIRKLFNNSELAIRHMTFVRQSTRHDYFRMMIAGIIKNDEVIETMIDEISIKDESDQYSVAFTTLLKKYYLNL
jgi:tRNA1Val (adenine37-N6)-methyltransferase